MIAPTRETAPAVVSPQARPRRLLILSLGAVLVLLVVLAAVTGLPYLLVRAGVSSPVPLDVVDGSHVYLGLVTAVVLVAKVWRVGARRAVRGVGLPELWHRWVSASLGVAYGAVLLSGALLLPHWPGNVRTALVNVHLIAAVWAAVPTAWHAWHYRRLLASLVRGPSQGSRPRPLLLGSVVLVAGVLMPVLAPRALAPLTQNGAGNPWVADGPPTFLDRMETTPDGRWIVAGGDGLYVRAAGGQRWDAIPGLSAADTVLGLTLPTGPTAAYVGTSRGLFAGADVHGPYRQLPFPSREVHGIAVDPGDPATVWASSIDGFFVSHDGGQHWTLEDGGLSQPSTAWAVAYFRGAVFAADVDAVYRWTGARWEPSNGQRFVVTFDSTPDGRLLASSMGDGLRAYDGHTWEDVSDGLPRHGHDTGNGTTHVVSVTALPAGMAYAATMLEGVAVSNDAAQSWASTWPGLRANGTIWRVLAVDGRLVAATDQGMLSYQLPVIQSAGVFWWTLLVICAALAGVLGLAIAATPEVGRRGPAPP